MDNMFRSEIVSPSGGGSASPLTTKGDLYTYSTVAARLGVGTNGFQLVADSSAATGLKWAAPASGTGNVTDINSDATASQVLAVGTAGTDFAIVDNGTGTHTFNLPDAAAASRGVVTTGAQTIAGAKTFSQPIAGAASWAFYKDVNVGDSTNLVQLVVGNSGSSQGVGRFAYTNAAASSTPTLKIAFDPRKNDDSTNYNAGLLQFAKTASSDGSAFIIQTSTTGGVLTTGLTISNAQGATFANTVSMTALTCTTIAASGAISANLTTDSTSGTTGSIICAGGIGVASGKGLVCGTYHLEPTWIDNGNSGTADTIDWSAGAAQKSTATGNVTYTFSNPGVAGSIFVLGVYTGAGSFTATWPATVKWASAPTLTVTASRMDLFSFTWDGSSYYGSYVQNYTP